MKSLIFVVFLIGLAGNTLGRSIRHAGLDPQIVNGTDAELGQFPFAVALLENGCQMCGGSILAERWILTAAHCVQGSSAELLSIVAGTNNYRAGGIHVNVENYIKHEDWDSVNLINDIAIIKLKEPLVFSELIQPVKVPPQGLFTPGGIDVTVMGFGHLYSSGPKTSHLKYVKIMTYSDEECLRLHSQYLLPNPKNICAGVPEGGKGQCTGDSGGPLIIGDNGHQVGIVSWSVKPCALAGYPGVYTEVSYFVDWIENKISENS